MDNNIYEEQVETYQLQRGLLLVLLFAIILTINYISKLLGIAKECRNPTAEEISQVQKQAKLSSFLFLVVSFAFFILAYKQKNKTQKKSDYYFFIASSLVLVAAFIRIYFIFNGDEATVAAEDIF